MLHNVCIYRCFRGDKMLEDVLAAHISMDDLLDMLAKNDIDYVHCKEGWSVELTYEQDGEEKIITIADKTFGEGSTGYQVDFDSEVVRQSVIDGLDHVLGYVACQRCNPDATVQDYLAGA